jgi:hypothetical protein
MPATVLVNNLTVVHQTSNGVVTTFPDVCKTPSPGGPIPLPYPNVAQSTTTSDGSSSVTADGNPIMLKTSSFVLSTGDEAGSAMGVVSNKIKGKAYPTMYSFDVKVEGQNVFRQTDLMLGNGGSPTNTPPAANMQPGSPLLPGEMSKLKDPEKQKITKLAWKKTDVCCGDEAELEVKSEGFKSELARITIARPGEGGPICGWFGVSMAENGHTYKWIVRRGPFAKEVKLEAQQSLWDGEKKSSNQLNVKVPPDKTDPPVKVNRTAPVYEWRTKRNSSKKELVRDPTSNYGWEACFEMAFTNGRLSVTRKVDFDRPDGARPSPTQFRRWKREVEGVWDAKYRLHRKNCQRGTRCDCGGWSNGCCTFPIRVVCEFGPGPGKRVTLHKGANHPTGREKELSPGVPNPNYGRWWYSHDWWEGLRNVPGTVRAHEFGHLIGMYDEYPEGAAEASRRYADVPKSIMNAGRKVYPRHFEEFAKWFRSHAEPILGPLELLRTSL